MLPMLSDSIWNDSKLSDEEKHYTCCAYEAQEHYPGITTPMVSNSALGILSVVDNLDLLTPSVFPSRTSIYAFPDYFLPIIGGESDNRVVEHSATTISIQRSLLPYIHYYSSGTYSISSQGDFLL